MSDTVIVNFFDYTLEFTLSRRLKVVENSELPLEGSFENTYVPRTLTILLQLLYLCTH